MVERINMQCPQCGGDIVLSEDKKFGKCLSCENEYYYKQEKTAEKISLYNHANFCRRRNDFEGAILAYNDLLKIDNTDSEAYWGIVLSIYGIEYVIDPKTDRNVATCRRIVGKSVFYDRNYLNAVEFAQPEQRDKYRQEAVMIDKLQQSIKEKLNDEDSYDVFICFKSSDECGFATEDRVVARKIYDELTGRGIKTFFSEISLKDRLGSEYEPIIYKALYTSKVMILVATKEDYINSVWLRNEWARFRDRIHEENLKDASFAVFKDVSRNMLPPIFRTQGIDLRKYPFGGYEIEIADALSLRFSKNTAKHAEAVASEDTKSVPHKTECDGVVAENSACRTSQFGFGKSAFATSGGQSDTNRKFRQKQEKSSEKIPCGLTKEEVNRDLTVIIKEKNKYVRARDRAQGQCNVNRIAMKKSAEQRKQFAVEREKLDYALRTPDFYKRKARRSEYNILWLRILMTVLLVGLSIALIDMRIWAVGIIVGGAIIIWRKQVVPPGRKKVEGQQMIDREREKQLREQIIQCEIQLVGINQRFDRASRDLTDNEAKIAQCDELISEYIRVYDFAARQLEKINGSLTQKVANVVSDGIIEIGNGIDKGISVVKEALKK